MLSINEIKIGKLLKVSDEPYVVLKADHHKMGRGGAVLKVKLKNIITGNILDKTFQGNDKADEASTEKKKANYMYKDDNEVHLMDNVSFEQFSIDIYQVGDKIKFLKDGTDVDVLYYNEKPIVIDLPIKVDLKVVSAPPGVKGNSAGNVTKVVDLETGTQLSVPMFINQGDVIRVNTDTGEYVERA